LVHREQQEGREYLVALDPRELLERPEQLAILE